MSKKRRSSGLWKVCENENCRAHYAESDAEVHKKNCPPVELSSHTFIKDEVYYFTIENDKANVADFVKRSSNPIHTVFISESISQLCQILQDDFVVIRYKYDESDKNKYSVVVKKAFLVNNELLNSVYLTKNVMELNGLRGPAQLEKLKVNPLNAAEIFINGINKSSTQECTSDLINKINSYHDGMIFTVGNKISINKQKLIYHIIDIKAGDNLNEKLSNLTISEDEKNLKQLFLSSKSTKWTFVKTVEQPEDKKKQTESNGKQVENKQSKLINIGGYSSLTEKLKKKIEFRLGKYNLKDCEFKFSKGILLYGLPGVGKSMISDALLSDIQAHVVKLDTSTIIKEQAVQALFKEAIEKAPTVIFIDNIDKLCPKKSRSVSDENKVLDNLKSQIDDLYNNGNNGKNVVILATTSKLDAVDVSLRQAGRIDIEYEIPVPTREVRKEIFTKLIQLGPHKLTDDDINEISFQTHGFVGADIYKLCTEAYEMKKLQVETSEKIHVTREDFNKALKIVNPSAMKEVLVDVPYVKWSDIGGLKDLKNKLLQAVEWPLKHPEVYTKFGREPPKGILLFGPPGCSKTMIAKALATETKLNFLNVKGPELFSKYVGDSEKAVRELFQKARQVSPCIIFIDEIETLVIKRGDSSNSGGGSVQERVLTQLLTELDGVTSLKNVLLVAATNRPDKIDKALLRPGRFDKLFYVPLPNAEGRLEIFKIKTNKMPLSTDVILQDLVNHTVGYSGAEIQEICNEAFTKALEDNMNDPKVTKKHFDTAISESFPRTDKSSLKIYQEFYSKPRTESDAAPRFCKWLRFWKRK